MNAHDLISRSAALQASTIAEHTPELEASFYDAAPLDFEVTPGARVVFWGRDWTVCLVGDVAPDCEDDDR